MHHISQKAGLKFVAGLCMIALSAGLGISVAKAEPKQQRVAVASTQPAPPTDVTRASQRKSPPNGERAAMSYPDRPYYVDFRARNAQTYGHAFVWFGRRNERKVEVAGLHPATDSWIPYALGHILPVPSETGASYGDLDEEYLLASYRIYLTEAQAQKVFAYIKYKQANSPLWNAATYNCVMFISNIAEFMGMRVPGSHLLYPEDWVKELATLNRARKTVAF